MRTLLALLLVPLAGAGTAVGNPTGLTLDTAAGTGLAYTSAVAEVDAIVVTDRKGVVTTVAVDDRFDLLGGTRVEVPLADAARVAVRFGGPVEITGASPAGDTFALSLDVDSLEVSLAAPTGELPDAVLRLGAPGWLTADVLGLDGADVAVSAGDPLHDVLVDALVGGAALYRDDGDGRCEEVDDADEIDEDEADDLDDTEDDDCTGTPLGTAE